MKICIDAGHNYSGYNTGATGNGLREQDVTFYIADKLKNLFENIGVGVLMTRPTLETNCGKDNATSLSYRYNLANSSNCDLFISLHCNAGGGRGTETLVYSTKGDAYKVAEGVQEQIVSKLGTANRGVKLRTDLAVLKNTNMPAILVETAFIDNIDDAKLLTNNQNEFAQALFDGVCKYYGLNEREGKSMKFKDIEGHWAEKHIEKLADYGIVNGDGDGNFNPDKPITRAEVAVIVGNALTVLGK